MVSVLKIYCCQSRCLVLVRVRQEPHLLRKVERLVEKRVVFGVELYHRPS